MGSVECEKQGGVDGLSVSVKLHRACSIVHFDGLRVSG